MKESGFFLFCAAAACAKGQLVSYVEPWIKFWNSFEALFCFTRPRQPGSFLKIEVSRALVTNIHVGENDLGLKDVDKHYFFLLYFQLLVKPRLRNKDNGIKWCP